MNQSETITFSFGENWKDYLPTINDAVIREATADIAEWLGTGQIKGKRVVDVGSGSGLSSLCFYNGLAAELVSFDYDQRSVEATAALKERVSGTEIWRILRGSILDDAFVDGLGRFDVVYSWGVLHHTGDIWAAIANTQRLCGYDGLVWISIYQAGDLYERHLELKKSFNRLSRYEKKRLIERHALERYPGVTASDAIRRLKSNIVRRGMNEYNDWIDWLGGLPYEVAYPSEIISRFIAQRFRPIKVVEEGQGGCTVYLFKRENQSEAPNINSVYIWGHLLKPGVWETRSLVDQIAHDFARSVQMRQSAREIVIRAARDRVTRLAKRLRRS